MFLLYKALLATTTIILFIVGVVVNDHDFLKRPLGSSGLSFKLHRDQIGVGDNREVRYRRRGTKEKGGEQ